MRIQALVVLAIGCAAGCTTKSQPDPTLTELQNRVAKLEADHAIDTDTIQKMNKQLFMEDFNHPTFAMFSPANKVFEPIYASNPPQFMFLVALEDVKPYANGYKVSFDLGNPSSLQFKDLEIEIKWRPERPVYKVGDATYADRMVKWQEQERSTKQTVDKALRPGAWNAVEFILAPATQADIAELEVGSITTKSVSLQR